MTSSEARGNSVFITGATSGIGKETTALFLAKGWRVLATARTDALAIKLHEEFDHPNLEVITCEVHIEESCQSAIKRVLELVPSGPNVIVNNAGFALPGAIEDVELQDAEHQLDTNLLAPARFIQGFLPLMRKLGEGRIINISSVSGLVAMPFIGWYSASKFGLEAISDALRVELMDTRIKIVIIEPTSFASNIWAKASKQMPSTQSHQDHYRSADRIINARYPAPTAVAQAIFEAATTSNPKHRYLVGKQSRVAALLRILPSKLSDYLVAINIGLKQTPIKRWTRGN